MQKNLKYLLVVYNGMSSVVQWVSCGAPRVFPLLSIPFCMRLI